MLGNPVYGWVLYMPFLLPSDIILAALIYAVGEAEEGQHPSFARSYLAIFKRIRSVLGVAVVYWGLSQLLFASLVGSPLAIYLMVRWLFGTQAVVIGGLRTGEALALSSRIVKGIWWQIAGLAILLAAFILGPFAIAGLLLGPWHPATLVLSPLATTALAPFLTSFQTLLFLRLRERERAVPSTSLGLPAHP